MNDHTHAVPWHDDEAQQAIDLADSARRLDQIEREMSEPTPYNLAMAKILGARTREEIDDAEAVARRWIQSHPEDEAEFRRYLSDLRRRGHTEEREQEIRRGWGPHEWERYRVDEQAYNAETLEEIARAQEAITAWLEQHPEDAGEFEDAKDELEVKAKDEIERTEEERDQERGRSGLTDLPGSRGAEG